MEKNIMDLYRQPDIDQYQNLDLLSLSETCAALEERVYEIAEGLSAEKRAVIEDYISTRNDLELETFRTAFRWGKVHIR